MVKQIMLDYPMAVLVTEVFTVASTGNNFVTACILALFVLSRKKDIVIVDRWAKRPGARVVIPFLDEKDTCFSACMRFERI